LHKANVLRVVKKADSTNKKGDLVSALNPGEVEFYPFRDFKIQRTFRCCNTNIFAELGAYYFFLMAGFNAFATQTVLGLFQIIAL
jgi:hypothetical protein